LVSRRCRRRRPGASPHHHSRPGFSAPRARAARPLCETLSVSSGFIGRRTPDGGRNSAVRTAPWRSSARQPVPRAEHSTGFRLTSTLSKYALLQPRTRCSGVRAKHPRSRPGGVTPGHGSGVAHLERSGARSFQRRRFAPPTLCPVGSLAGSVPRCPVRRARPQPRAGGRDQSTTRRLRRQGRARSHVPPDHRRPPRAASGFEPRLRLSP
jgi:hypothetical protein